MSPSLTARSTFAVTRDVIVGFGTCLSCLAVKSNVIEFWQPWAGLL